MAVTPAGTVHSHEIAAVNFTVVYAPVVDVIGVQALLAESEPLPATAVGATLVSVPTARPAMITADTARLRA